MKSFRPLGRRARKPSGGRLGFVREGASQHAVTYAAHEANAECPGAFDLAVWDSAHKWSCQSLMCMMVKRTDARRSRLTVESLAS
jgi:hypothetical protein